MDNINIGDQIKKYRKLAKLSQRELGNKIGMSQQQIAQYESGKRIPKIETINNIAGALGIGVRRLYPDFSHDEWMQTETAKKSAEMYNLAMNGVFAILSYKYKIVEEKNSNDEILFSITLNNKKYTFGEITLEAILHCLADTAESIFELIKNVPEDILSENAELFTIKCDNNKKPYY